MSRIHHAAPQFLVDDLERSVAFYRDRLGFEADFVYDDFYASVSRDGVPIHLKHADKLEAERTLRKAEEHLDAYVSVEDVRGLHTELEQRGTRISKPLEERPWGERDFYVEDPDGYILCFSESASG